MEHGVWEGRRGMARRGGGGGHGIDKPWKGLSLACLVCRDTASAPSICHRYFVHYDSAGRYVSCSELLW